MYGEFTNLRCCYTVTFSKWFERAKMQTNLLEIVKVMKVVNFHVNNTLKFIGKKQMGITKDDLFCEAMLVLVDCIPKFNPEKASFPHFFSVCLHNHFIEMITKIKVELVELPFLEMLPDRVDDFESVYERDYLNRILQRLNDVEKSILILKLFPDDKLIDIVKKDNKIKLVEKHLGLRKNGVFQFKIENHHLSEYFGLTTQEISKYFQKIKGVTLEILGYSNY